MFLIARVTVAVECTLSCASETSFSYGQDAGIDHDPPLRTESEVDRDERRLVVVEPLDTLRTRSPRG